MVESWKCIEKNINMNATYKSSKLNLLFTASTVSNVVDYQTAITEK